MSTWAFLLNSKGKGQGKVKKKKKVEKDKKNYSRKMQNARLDLHNI